jgi:hypothetical protein
MNVIHTVDSELIRYCQVQNLSDNKLTCYVLHRAGHLRTGGGGWGDWLHCYVISSHGAPVGLDGHQD